MLKTLLSLPVLVAAGCLAACAGQGPPPEFESGPGGPGGPGGATLFISPSGQPFRAPPGQPYPSAAWFAGADADHDGRLSPAEFRADAEAFFRSLDTDHDGVVDGFENAAYEHAMPEMAPRVRSLQAGEGMDRNLGRRDGGFDDANGRGGGGRPSRGRGGGREGAGLFSYFYDPQPVSAADTDFSSKITLAEADALAERRFAMLDTAKAGYLSLATLPKTPVQALAEARAKDRRRNRGGPGVEQAPGPDRLQQPQGRTPNGPA